MLGLLTGIRLVPWKSLHVHPDNVAHLEFSWLMAMLIGLIHFPMKLRSDLKLPMLL